jgi:hypothetical protein
MKHLKAQLTQRVILWLHLMIYWVSCLRNSWSMTYMLWTRDQKYCTLTVYFHHLCMIRLSLETISLSNMAFGLWPRISILMHTPIFSRCRCLNSTFLALFMRTLIHNSYEFSPKTPIWLSIFVSIFAVSISTTSSNHVYRLPIHFCATTTKRTWNLCLQTPGHAMRRL